MQNLIQIKNGSELSVQRSFAREAIVIMGSLSAMIMVTGAIYVLGLKGVVLIIGMLIALPTAYALLCNERLLVPISIAYSIFLGPFLMAVGGVPIGLLMDAMLLTGVLGVVLRALKNRDWSWFDVPGKTVLIVWVGYHLLQVGNPAAASRVAWFYVMRPAVAYPFLYFITYNMMKSKKDLNLVWGFIVAGITITIIWGLVQQVRGYFDFEMNYLVANEAIHLVYIQGRYRIFGTLTSPAQYGVVVTIFSMVFMLMGAFLKSKTKYLYIILALIGFAAMVFSGTRTAYIVIPLTIAALIVLERSAKLYGLSAILGVIFLLVILMPTNNYHIQRIQSVFKTEEDASYQVREQNRKAIMPFIYSHPLGGGLGSTGVWGMRFSPHTMLAQFAPDAGYMRVAVELGWIGLILYAFLLVKMFLLSLFSYMKLKDPDLRIFGLALLSALSSLFLIEYAQDINGKLPMNILLWILFAVMIKLPELQKEVPDGHH